MLPVTPELIAQAQARIAPYVRRTPLLALPELGKVSLKLELVQHAGSFKTRGAFNNLLSRQVPTVGVAAASGGNHGVAVAQAASRLKVPARIFVPEIASKVKVAAITAAGAQVVIGGARYADAQAACDVFAKEHGALILHPYDSVATMSGAGTVALEWDEDGEGLDTVLVACGGGGLVAGMAAWWQKRVKVIAVEPEGSRCLHAALEAGAPVDVPVESVAADSLGARRVGTLVFEVARELVDRVVLVQDDHVRQAQAWLWSNVRLAAEPGGAAALAALLSGRYVPAAGERVGVLLCGSNLDPSTLGTP
jgi:threonine dehydratase